MTYSYFSDVVSDWALRHPEMKESFELVYEYQAVCQAFHIRMEYVPYHRGMCHLLGEDVLDKLVCPHDYIFAVLDDMYETLKEDEEKEREKLRDFIRSWLIINADHHDVINVRIEQGTRGHIINLAKKRDGKNICVIGRLSWNGEDAWGAFTANLYKKLKEKEKKEMGMDIEFARREDNDVRLKMAKAAVVKWYNEYNQSYPIGIEDVYIVWFCKVLQNWKALAGTHHSDGMYYEVTFDGNNKLVYFDAYKKWQNVQMSGRDLEKGVC